MPPRGFTSGIIPNFIFSADLESSFPLSILPLSIDAPSSLSTGPKAVWAAMDSHAQDFEMRSRSDTSATVPHSLHQPVTTFADDTQLRRTGTGGSRMSTGSVYNKNSGMRRSNTVKTYHPQETTEPNWQPGAEPGVDTTAEDDAVPDEFTKVKAQCEITIVDYSDVHVRNLQADNTTLAEALETPRPDDLPCRWISVNGLSWDVIKLLGNKYSLHRLAIEDLMHTHTRTKVDWYADHAFIVLTLQKLVRLHQHYCADPECDCNSAEEREAQERHRKSRKRPWWKTKAKRKPGELPYYLDKDGDGKIDEFVKAHSGTSEAAPIRPIRTLHRYESAQIPEHTAFMEKNSALSSEDLAVSVEQVSIFLLADNTVISFFEQSAGDVEEPIQERLQSTETILRRSADASLLTQAIIDAIVDLAVYVKDAYNMARKELQVDALTNPNIATSRKLHIFGEEIDMVQNLFKPIVHLVNALRDHQSEAMSVAATNTPPAADKTKRNREGAPTYNRSQSEFRKTMLKRSDQATSVSITPLAHTYFGDVLDHCITIIQSLEQMDASANNISTLIFNTVGAKTNNFMMIMTVVTVLFAPITFVASYFGMNFAGGEGLQHPFAFFWIVALPILIVFTFLVLGFMFWESIGDFLKKRGLKRSQKRRSRRR